MPGKPSNGYQSPPGRGRCLPRGANLRSTRAAVCGCDLGRPCPQGHGRLQTDSFTDVDGRERKLEAYDFHSALVDYRLKGSVLTGPEVVRSYPGLVSTSSLPAVMQA